MIFIKKHFLNKLIKFSWTIPIFIILLISISSLISQSNKILKLQNPVIYYNGAIFTLEKESIMNEVLYQMNEISKKGFWNGSHEKLALFLEAFRNLTIKNAIQNNTENEVGSLSSGKLANIIILDKNPLLYNPAKYNEIQVYSIILEGKRLL